LAILAILPSANAASPRDRFDGWPGAHGRTTGFFHTEQLDQVWWLITPEGNAFFSKAVNHINYNGDTAPALGYAPYGRAVAVKYGSAEKWAKATADRLRGMGFNTVGAWSSSQMFEQQLPYTLILDLASTAGANWQRGDVADVFSPAFTQAVRQRAQKLCAPRARDPFLLGYFSDNELRWGADWRSKKTLSEEFLSRPPEAPGKQALIRLLRARYHNVEDFNQAWGTRLSTLDELPTLTTLPLTSDAAQTTQRDFLREYARAYFQTCYDAIRAADPNHLILGCRFAGYAPQEVVEAMADFVDVVSFNNYSFAPPTNQLRALHTTTRKPLMLTEFSFKANDSGLPNTKGAGKPVATQHDRAEHFERYVSALAKMPFLVGYHWFQYSDQPAEGRFDGENSNYGLVNRNDEPWLVLVERITQLNQRLEDIHRLAPKP
jgi:agarase